MTDMPCFSSPVDRSLSTSSTASGAATSIHIFQPFLPFADSDAE